MWVQRIFVLALLGLMGASAMAEDARTAISRSQVIDQSGAYYLAANIQGKGIVIAANDVTLDLNGYRLDGAGDSGAGILLSHPDGGGLRNIEIRDGTVTGYRGNGIRDNARTVGIRLIGLRVVENGGGGASAGGEGAGIWLQGSAAWIDECTASGNRGHGAVLGPYAAVRSSRFERNGLNGLVADEVTLIADNAFDNNAGHGVDMQRLTIATGIRVRDNASGGVHGAGVAILEGNAIQRGMGDSANLRGGPDHAGVPLRAGNRVGRYGIDRVGIIVDRDARRIV